MRQWRAGRAMVGAVCVIAVGVGLLAPVLRLPVRAAGQPFIVTRTADDTTDANCNAATSGGCTLREAINASNANDPGDGTNTITFAPGVTGTILLTTTGTGYGTLAPVKNVTIIGPGANLLTISGQFAVRVFTVTRQIPSITAVAFGVQDLTIAYGSVTASSGTESFSGAGGGIAAYIGNLNLVHVIFTGNAATRIGGAIAAEKSFVNATGCLFIFNSATVSGGAIQMGAETILQVTNSTFSRNTAASGGAIDLIHNTLVLTGSTVSQNTTTNALSDAIDDDPSSAKVASSIISGNGNASGSSGADIISGYTDGGGNVIGGSALLDVLNTNAPGTIPTYALLPGSPAIDGGTCAYTDAGGTMQTLATDARGVARPQGALCDAGAFESRGFTLGTLHGNTQAAAVGTAYAAPLSLTVTSAFGEPVVGGQVTFTAPTTGASVTFGTGGGCTLSVANTVATCPVAGDGTVTSPTLTANGIAGVVTVSATARGVATPAPFQLGNAPTLTAIGPTSGDVRGGTAVTLRGAGFGTDMTQVQVFIDGTPVPLAVFSPTALTVIAPAHRAGNVPVSIQVTSVGALTARIYTYGVVLATPAPAPTHATTGMPGVAVTHTPGPMPGAGTPTPLPQPMRR